MRSDDQLSLRNPKVQHLRRLIGRRRSRSESGQFVFEGPTLLREALACSYPIEAVFFDHDESEALAPLRAAVADRAEVHSLAKGVLAKVADASAPQGVIVVAPRPRFDLTTFLESEPRGLVYVLDRINDPGNAGAIIRTAEAVGATAVVFADHSTDPFGPKTVRAAAGSAFRLPLLEVAATRDLLDRLGQLSFSRVGTVARGGDHYRDVDLSGDVALVLGSESHGLGSEVEASLDRRLSIPMRGAVESLNVASTAAVLGFERLRQLDAAGSDI